MNKIFSIKCLSDKNALSDKLLQNIYVRTIRGSIVTDSSFKSLFDISISSDIINISSIKFQDMNLNIFNCKFTFNIISIDNFDKAIFSNYDYNFIINNKTFNKIENCELLLFDGYAYINSESNIEFNIVIGLDFSTNNIPNNQIVNPTIENNSDFINDNIKLLFDEEFI